MPRLIHVNGPPGIGKSTLARRYADQHPGVLDLDIDQVRSLIGGWQDHFNEAGAQARPIALAMAATHLRAGHDVVMPQYLGRIDEIAKFEAVARDTSAAFVEVMLTDTREAAIRRFDSRGDDHPDPWHGQVRAIVAASGGKVLLGQMYDRLALVAAARTDAVIVDTRVGDLDGAYQALLQVLAATED